MKLLIENWRRYLKENAEPNSEHELKLMQAVLGLEIHVSYEGGSLWKEDYEFLAKTNDPRVVKYSGPAYRGVRLEDFDTLLKMLNLDDTYVFRGEIPWFNKHALTAINNPGRWVAIIPPAGTRVVSSKIRGGALQSFTKSFERAQIFSSGADKSTGKTTWDARSGTPNLEVIFVAAGDGAPFIDVNETLAKNKNDAGRQLEPEFPEDVEVLSIGDRVVNKILIKIKPGAESSKMAQNMLRWIRRASQKKETSQE